MKLFILTIFSVTLCGCGELECPDLQDWQTEIYAAASPSEQPLLCAEFLFANHNTVSHQATTETDDRFDLTFSVTVE